MFALMASTDYEGQDLLGVYSSLSAAVVQAQRFMEADDLFWGDEMVIYEMPIDADADSVYARRPTWSHRP